MKQQILLTVSSLLIGFLILGPSPSSAICNVCSDYGVACVNETSFNLCFGDKPETSQIYTCPLDKLCSATSLKCIDRSSGGKPACEPSKGCGVCDGDKMFACTSRTTYAQCDGETLTKNTGVCPDHLVCDSQGGELCVDECTRPTKLECEREVPL